MSACCSSAGRLFHSFRPATAKHLSDNTRPWCGRTQLVKHAGKMEVNNLAVKLIQQPTQMFPNKQSPRL